MSSTIHTVILKYVENNQSGAIKNLRGMGKEGENVSTAIKGIGLAAGAFTVVATAALATTAKLAQMGNVAATAGDSIGKTSKALSVTAEELQELRIVANDSGIAITELDGALKTFNEKTGEASRGVGEARYWFDRLNISAKEVNGTYKTNVELFYETGRAIANLTSETERADAMNKIYGGNGYKLVELFRQSEATISQTIATAREYGAVLSNDVVAGAEAYRSKLDLIMQGTQALEIQRGLALAPLTLEWELMKNEIANSTINLMQFVGILDIPVTKARARLKTLKSEMDNLQSRGDKSNINQRDIDQSRKILEDEYDEMLEIVIEADNARAQAESDARLARIAHDKANAEERQRLADELEKKLQKARDTAEASRVAREEAAAAQRIIDVAKAEQKARDQLETNQMEAALNNQAQMTDQIRQMQIRAIEDEKARAMAQTGFDIQQYELQNSAALNHISTRAQAELDFIEFKRLKTIELAKELSSIDKELHEDETARMAEKNKLALNYANQAISAMSEYFTATGQNSAATKEQIINDLRSMIIQALLFRSIAALSGGSLVVGSTGNLTSAPTPAPPLATTPALDVTPNLSALPTQTLASRSRSSGLTQNITIQSATGDPVAIANQVSAVARREAQNVYDKNRAMPRNR